jgi:hypothetical protein
MSETAPHMITPTVRPTLEVVRNQFEAWRKRKHRGRRIPAALWQAAVELCGDHSVWEVSRALRLSYNDLKNHVHKTRDIGLGTRQGPDFGFVKLDLGAPITPSECLVEMEAPSGAKMRMSFKGAPRDFDPVELSRAFWRQGQ